MVPPPHEITFYVNNNPFKAPQHEVTGEQIKQLAGIPLDYELFEQRGKESSPVRNQDRVHLHAEEHFRAIPAATMGM
jgi:hypothetical protein